MQQRKSLRLADGWFIDKDAENCGRSLEWDSAISETALPAADRLLLNFINYLA